jgi:dipeptidase E
MKLLLTSDGFTNPTIGKKFLDLIGKSPAEIRLLFIPTACRSPEELKYVAESRRELIDMGIPAAQVADIDLSHPYSNAELASFDAVYVCGGNTFYLLSQLRKYGVDGKLIDMVKDGKVYLGVSAGTVIAGPDASIASPFDENDVGLTDMRGMQLIDCVITPHYDKKEQSIIDAYAEKSSHRLIRLKDGQAVLVIDEQEQIIQ